MHMLVPRKANSACSAPSTESRAYGATFVISKWEEVSLCNSATTSCSSEEIGAPLPRNPAFSISLDLDFLVSSLFVRRSGLRSRLELASISRCGPFDFECLVRGDGQATSLI